MMVLIFKVKIRSQLHENLHLHIWTAKNVILSGIMKTTKTHNNVQQTRNKHSQQQRLRNFQRFLRFLRFQRFKCLKLTSRARLRKNGALVKLVFWYPSTPTPYLFPGDPPPPVSQVTSNVYVGCTHGECMWCTWYYHQNSVFAMKSMIDMIKQGIQMICQL